MHLDSSELYLDNTENDDYVPDVRTRIMDALIGWVGVNSEDGDDLDTVETRLVPDTCEEEDHAWWCYQHVSDALYGCQVNQDNQDIQEPAEWLMAERLDHFLESHVIPLMTSFEVMDRFLQGWLTVAETDMMYQSSNVKVSLRDVDHLAYDVEAQLPGKPLHPCFDSVDQESYACKQWFRNHILPVLTRV